MPAALQYLASIMATAFVVLAIAALVGRILWVVAGKPALFGKDDPKP